MSNHSGLTVVVLEDQPLIALDIEEHLNQAGIDDVVTWSSCLEAERWLETHAPDFAVMETCVRDGSTDRIVHQLDARNIPIIIHSGAEFLPHLVEKPAGAERIWVNKPCPPELLLQAIKKLGVIAYRPEKSVMPVSK